MSTIRLPNIHLQLWYVSRCTSNKMQCIDIVERNQPVELEIFWTSPSLTRKLSLFDHHIAEGMGGSVAYQLCATRRICAYATQPR
jgi:hypothetical protein